jgi:hypothetical protein
MLFRGKRHKVRASLADTTEEPTLAAFVLDLNGTLLEREIVFVWINR